MSTTKKITVQFQKAEKLIRELNEKILTLKKEKKESNRTIRKRDKRVKQLEESRDNWKKKAKDKKLENKALSDKQSREGKASRHHYPMVLVELCQKLRLNAGCSYRSIPKILATLNTSFNLGLTSLPCANTIQHWVSKMGLYKLVTGGVNLKEEVCLIIDECTGVGREKLLVILACPAKKKGKEALSFADVQVCYIGGRGSWNSEGIAEKLREVADRFNFEVSYILSDQASVMTCAARVFGVPHLPDIGHVMGTCLRKTFEKEDEFVKFTKLVSSCQSKSVNRKLVYLRPPKQRIKARFMNMKPMTEWARTMLSKFGKLGEEEQEFFKELGEHELIVNSLEQCISIAERIGLLLKKKGLSKSAVKDLNAIVAEHEEEGQLKVFLKHVKTYLAVYEEFTKESMGTFQASSDIIESMFGKYKEIRGSNPLVGLSLLCLELPTYSVKSEDFLRTAKNALEEVLMSNLEGWRKTQSSNKQAIKRQMFFKKCA